jgi:hypothetical protein
MTLRRYVQVGYPWAAAFEAGRPEPLNYLADLIRQTLRYGMPARRYGNMGAWIVRHGVRKPLLKTALRVRRRGPRPDIDALVADVAGAWEQLAERARWLPDSAPDLTVLALQRRSALTVFLFGEDPRPLVVAKSASGSAETLELEARALQEAERAAIAPRFLGRVGDTYVQEAIPGEPLTVQPVTPDTASVLEWTDEHNQLADGFIRLAETTRRPGPPQELKPHVREALAKADLGKRLHGLVSSTLDELGEFRYAVLRHGDTSAQNCLFEEGRLRGLVDWAIARPSGAPGFDVLNGAVALLDHGVGLVNWSEQRAVECFETAWKSSSFFESARQTARMSVEAAGATANDYERLEVAFFARRLASRLVDPDYYATGPASAVKMLEIACGR